MIQLRLTMNLSVASWNQKVQTYYTGNFSCVDGYFMMEREIGYYLIYDKRCSFVSWAIIHGQKFRSISSH